MAKVLITGCSTGIGFSLATYASKRGHEVVATMREPAGRNAERAAALREACGGHEGRIHVVELDVTSDASVESAIASARAEVGELDALVHNAGLGSVGLLETFTTEQLRQVFEVNVLGAHRLARAALPAMRARKQGLLVFVSSAIGRILFPYFGAYGPSKFALEALGELYHGELRPCGIDVTVVQPGGFATQFFANVLRPSDCERIASYGEYGQLASNFWLRGEAPPLPGPDLVSEGIVELIEAEPGTRPLRKVIDPMMGEALEAINQSIAAVQAPVLRAMGFEP
jgi:NAD(P)-dependent dehydrogenase (short-subunit alcohol dehydrogenase family)